MSYKQKTAQFFSVLILLSPTIYAFSNDDLETYKLTKTCNGCDLSSSNLSCPYTDLRQSRLNNSNLSYVTFAGNFSNSSFQNSRLVKSHIKFDSKLYFQNTNFNQANLSQTDFPNTIFSNSSFIDADLSSANLANSDLSSCDFTNANFMGVNLNNTNLENSNISTQQLSDAADICNAVLPSGFVYVCVKD